MNNKGFTLIEILAVLAVLGVIGVIVTISLTNTLNTTNQESCNQFIQEVEDAACVYAGLSNKSIVCNRQNCNPIPLSVLVSEGFIKSEIDKCTNEEINLDATVSVSWDESGLKTCHYNGEREYER